MKIWSVPSAMLDDGRLLRLHQSIHGALHKILRKPSKRTKNRFYRHGGYLVLRHWEAACEMRVRGMNHESPVDQIWKQIPEARRGVRFRHSRVEIMRDVAVLKKRQHNATTASGTCGRILAEGFPEDINKLAEQAEKDGLPADVFLI